eukprot:386905_1
MVYQQEAMILIIMLVVCIQIDLVMILISGINGGMYPDPGDINYCGYGMNGLPPSGSGMFGGYNGKDQDIQPVNGDRGDIGLAANKAGGNSDKKSGGGGDDKKSNGGGGGNSKKKNYGYDDGNYDRVYEGDAVYDDKTYDKGYDDKGYGGYGGYDKGHGGGGGGYDKDYQYGKKDINGPPGINKPGGGYNDYSK